MTPSRGPQDYDPVDPLDVIEKLVARGGYREGNDTFSKWALTICGTLAVTAISGGVLMYGKITAFEAKLDSLQQQIARVERIVEPHYRGSQDQTP